MQCPQVKGTSALLEGEPHNSPVTRIILVIRPTQNIRKNKQEVIKEKTGRQQFSLKKHKRKWHMSRKKDSIRPL